MTLGEQLINGVREVGLLELFVGYVMWRTWFHMTVGTKFCAMFLLFVMSVVGVSLEMVGTGIYIAHGS